jgi:hypothetical protein
MKSLMIRLEEKRKNKSDQMERVEEDKSGGGKVGVPRANKIRKENMGEMQKRRE